MSDPAADKLFENIIEAEVIAKDIIIRCDPIALSFWVRAISALMTLSGKKASTAEIREILSQRLNLSKFETAFVIQTMKKFNYARVAPRYGYYFDFKR